MVRLYGLLFLAEIVLAVCALISCLSAEEGEIRALPRIAWVLIILFFPLIGSIAWFAAGREPGPRRSRTAWPMGNGFSEEDRRRRQVAPDDDPAFLQSIAERSRQQDKELFRRWEEDLRRREEELRRREREQDRPEV